MMNPGRTHISCTSLVAVLTLSLVPTVAAAQPPANDAPTRGGRGGGPPAVTSPDIASDRRVTFRLYAPNAGTVMVNGEWQGGSRLSMTKDAAGIWSVVTEPIAPEAYFYTFNVDGVTLNDPANPRRNVLFVPGSESSAYTVKDIPHGDIRQVWYPSPTMKMRRRMLVYTPPGYDKSSEHYPVLYLLHGWGGDEEEWTNAGYLPEIMDGLVAGKKITPMLVVMPNGHPDEPAAPHVWPVTRRPTLPNAQISEMHTRLSAQGLVDDVIPFVEANYRVKTSREDRAVAGLSMGGEQAVFTGLNHLDRFGWIGSFSGAFVMLPGRAAPSSQGETGINASMLATNFPQLSAEATRQLRLLYFSCGTDDTLLASNRDVKKWLKEKQIGFVDVETPAYAHVWRYWRVSLIDFAPRLFR